MDIGAVSSTPSASTGLQANGLGMQDFLKILLTQLTYQDPLKPMDNQQFMAQMAQFTALQQTQELNTKIDQLITNQAALQSVGLIGRTVEVQTEGGKFTGTVTALSFSSGTPQVTVHSSTGTDLTGVSLSQILAVR
jgi:flagellar basal-body rod modification protein FlgD